MVRRGMKVTWRDADNERLPDQLSEGSAIVLDLGRRGLLEGIGERIRIRRKGGYCGFDVLLVLLFYIATGTEKGVRGFWDLIRPHARKLAALGGRKRLPSPASLSRALDAVEPALLRPATEWLLSEASGIDAVLRHPSVQTYDARGHGWHVFDFDPTVTTLRHRALPEADDLPAARRRSTETAAPGYSGRKRGEVQFRRGTLQHVGSGVWLYATLAPGNGDGHAELEGALGVAVRTCERLAHPLDRALLRMDGAFGWVPYLAACRAAGVPFITRLTRPELFEQSDVADALRKGPWHLVPDSLSGPRRSALDLGTVTVPPGHDTRRSDGTPYEPVAVRVVVSRYPRKDEAEHGRVIDGWQYELFVVDVSVDALPAPDAVATYFGRASEENRFAQEDREVGLDRIFSYHLPGQELAVVAGLWVWNLRLVRGFELAPPPAIRPEQGPYAAQIDVRGAAASDDGSSAASADQSSNPPADGPPGGEGLSSERGPNDPPTSDESAATTRATDTFAGPATASGHAADDRGSVQRAATATPAADPLVETLREIDWEEALKKRSDWVWDPETGHLCCPAARHLVLTTVRNAEHARGRTGIIFCRPVGGCEPCDRRSTCLHSTQPRAGKHAEVSVPTPIAERLRALLRARRTPVPSVADPSTPVAPQQIRPKRSRIPFPLAAPALAAPRFAVLSSLFLPAAARHLFHSAAARISISVLVDEPVSKPRIVLVADSVGDRQHRRKTWRQNFERYALPPDAAVRVEIAGDGRLRDILSGDDEQATG
jgi:hypothetical protein